MEFLDSVNDSVFGVDKDITSFSFLASTNNALSTDVVATIEGMEITALIPFGTDRSSLIASFTVTGVSVAIDGVEQTSQITVNNFTSPLTYVVTGRDDSIKEYIVMVHYATSDAKDITSFSFQNFLNADIEDDVYAEIEGTDISVQIPNGVDMDALIASYISTGVSEKVNGVEQVSGITPNNFTNPVTYTITAADGSTKEYTVTAVEKGTLFTMTPGGYNKDIAYSIAIDSKDNIYITGSFSSTNMDFDPDEEDSDYHSTRGDTDIFITKIGSDGSYDWTQTIGGSACDEGLSIATDTNDDIYITGYFYDTVDFDPDTDVDSHTSNGNSDIFITKLESDGSYGITGWTRTIGSSGKDEGCSVATDTAGNIYVTGYFEGTVDFDPGGGTDNHTSNGNKDIFILKLDSGGNYVWAETIGGVDEDRGYSIAADTAGNIYVTGYFKDTVDFDPGGGTDNHTSNGGRDIFILKLDSNGNWVWAKTMGGTGWDEGYSIASDTAGNIYVTGYFKDTVDFDPGGGINNHTSNGGYDIFITKINSDGSYGWTGTMGSNHWSFGDTGYSITTDTSGNLFITGIICGNSADIDCNPFAGVDSQYPQNAIGGNIFLTKINSDGSYGWTYLIGPMVTIDNTFYGRSVVTDSDDNVCVTGVYYDAIAYTSVDFDPGELTDNHCSIGKEDIFIFKINRYLY